MASQDNGAAATAEKIESSSLEETLQMIAVRLGDLDRKVTSVTEITPQQRELLNNGGLDESAISQYEKKIKRASTWGGWVWGLASLVGLLFSGGVAWAVFMGANATDAEVVEAVQKAVVEHNDGIDPATIDSKTHKPVGHHPDIRDAVEVNHKIALDVQKTVNDEVIPAQKKLNKRSEYQYELGRWQASTMEAERSGRRAPGKPKAVSDLEGEIFRGEYDD